MIDELQFSLKETSEYDQVGVQHSETHERRRRVGDQRGLLEAREVDHAEHGAHVGHQGDGESRRTVEGAFQVTGINKDIFQVLISITTTLNTLTQVRISSSPLRK